jgi:hypothetical protein
MSNTKHYFLLSALVIYQRDKIERTRHFNILVTSDKKTINRAQIGNAQQQAQVRFFTEFDTENKSEVVDVFMQSVSHLGEMSEAEFHQEFDYPGKPELEGDPVQEPDAPEALAKPVLEEVVTDQANDTE